MDYGFIDVCDDYFYTGYGVYCLGDSRKIVRHIPDDSVDIVITDPPFGLNMDRYDVFEHFLVIEKDLWRILKHDAWLIFYFSIKKLPDAFRLKFFKYKWLIATGMPGGSYSKSLLGDARYMPILVFAKNNPKIVHRRWDFFQNLGELPFIQRKGLPKQFKPTTATMLLLQMFTHINDIVLDPFAGYGSIPFTCEVFHRRWIAIEIDKEKYMFAKKLILEKSLTNSVDN